MAYEPVVAFTKENFQRFLNELAGDVTPGTLLRRVLELDDVADKYKINKSLWYLEEAILRENSETT